MVGDATMLVATNNSSTVCLRWFWEPMSCGFEAQVLAASTMRAVASANNLAAAKRRRWRLPLSCDSASPWNYIWNSKLIQTYWNNWKKVLLKNRVAMGTTNHPHKLIKCQIDNLSISKVQNIFDVVRFV